MQTRFTPETLALPGMAEAESILRTCVHCGFCTATCPTYVTLGNELDSPRGRIYLIKEMFEQNRPADAQVALHVDRCLSCLACTTTCPSGVDYAHLIEQARAHVEATYKRPLLDRLLRTALASILTHPARFRLALVAARLARPLAPLLPAKGPLAPLRAMLAMAPPRLPRRAATIPTPAATRKVILLEGCAQSVLDPEINAAARRILTRAGIEVLTLPDEGCCGALPQHMGRLEQAKALARPVIDLWSQHADRVEAILTTTSGCGVTIKDWGHLFAGDPAQAEEAARIAGLARDITEYLATLTLPPPQSPPPLTVAYHAACSLQHGQKITAPPKALLIAAGFHVVEPAESHLCCGSAGTYNLLQPEIADQLGHRKAQNLARTGADLVAAGNIGCLTQIAAHADLPIVHTVQLIDWAQGGPRPAALAGLNSAYSGPEPVTFLIDRRNISPISPPT
jgi:glycolate oxidase iron-sulfur subunit